MSKNKKAGIIGIIVSYLGLYIVYNVAFDPTINIFLGIFSLIVGIFVFWFGLATIIMALDEGFNMNNKTLVLLLIGVMLFLIVSYTYGYFALKDTAGCASMLSPQLEKAWNDWGLIKTPIICAVFQ